MKQLRWLVACVFTLVLAACSSPEDLQAGVETQFGNANDNVGVDITSPFAGRVYVLSEEKYEEFYEDEAFYSAKFNDLYVSRYDGAGKLIWQRYVYRAGCVENCYLDFKSLGIYSDKNGYGYSYFVYAGSHSVLKTDSQGNVVREIDLIDDYYLESPSDSSLNTKVTVDTSGNIYFARASTLSDYDGNETQRNLVSKYNSSGTLLWKRTLSTGTPTGIAVSSAGNIYVSGSTGYAKYTSSGNLVWTKSGAGNDITVAGSYFYIRRGSTVLKYDSNGKQLWSKAQSGLSSPVYGEMTGDSAGNIYLSGKINVSGKARDGFVRKLNASGTVVWTKTNVASTTAYDDVRGITSVNGSEILITGETQGALAHSNRGGDNNRDGYVRELNSSGNSVWIK